jgi:hypothetical protein
MYFVPNKSKKKTVTKLGYVVLTNIGDKNNKKFAVVSPTFVSRDLCHDFITKNNLQEYRIEGRRTDISSDKSYAPTKPNSDTE